MPKQKTHSGAKKRFRQTRNSKVMHRRQNRNHILEKKSARRKRRLDGPKPLAGNGDRAEMQKKLGER